MRATITPDGDLEEERGGTTPLVAEGARSFSTKFRQSFGGAKDSAYTLAATQWARLKKLSGSVLVFLKDKLPEPAKSKIAALMESLGYKAKPTLTAEDFKVPPSAHVTTTKHNIKTDSHKENLEPYTLDGTVHYDTVAAPVGDLSSQAKAEAAVVYNGIMKAASSAIAAVSGAAAKKYVAGVFKTVSQDASKNLQASPTRPMAAVISALGAGASNVKSTAAALPRGVRDISAYTYDLLTNLAAAARSKLPGNPFSAASKNTLRSASDTKKPISTDEKSIISDETLSVNAPAT